VKASFRSFDLDILMSPRFVGLEPVYETLDKNYVSDATFGPIQIYKDKRKEN